MQLIAYKRLGYEINTYVKIVVNNIFKLLI